MNVANSNEMNLTVLVCSNSPGREMNCKQNYNWNIQWRGKLNYCLGGLPRLGAESRGRWRLVGITRLMSSEGCRISQHPPEAGIIQPPLSIGGWVYSALLPCIG